MDKKVFLYYNFLIMYKEYIISEIVLILIFYNPKIEKVGLMQYIS